MSGYLEVKYPLKPSLGLNPFKSWKKQWCILRPSTLSGGCLAVYCSEAGATAGSVELPSGAIVRRAKSRSRPYAFAVFHVEERKPRVLLAAQTLQEAQSWMDKLKTLLNGDKFGTEPVLKDSYSVSVLSTELSHKMGVYGDGNLAVSPMGLQFSRTHHTMFIQWQFIQDVALITENKDRICVITVDRGHRSGGGAVKVCGPSAGAVHTAVRLRRLAATKLSKSDGDLATSAHIEVRRSSWYSGPSEVSLDDMDLMSKEWCAVPAAQLSRSARAHELRVTSSPTRNHRARDSMSDRRSLLSVASGIYEEIPDLPEAKDQYTYCKMGHNFIDDVIKGVQPTIRVEEPTYESVSECRPPAPPPPPPPLPPRHAHTLKLSSSRSRTEVSVTRHGSLRALPAPDHRLNMFRKRVKSDSRVASSTKTDKSKENKDTETKKKKFDFTPTRDLFKSFKVSRKMKNLKITGSLTKGETKSCEFLDETKHVTANRGSKSVECLENDSFDEFDGDLSIELNDDAMAALALPQEILDIILRGREQLNKIRLKDVDEGDYMPMSPIIPPPPIEHHYIVMSPKTNLA